MLLKKCFLEKYGLPTSIREQFVPAIDRLMDEPVDIFLGNHVGNNDTVGKSLRMTEECNPFIDREAWKIFLQRTKEDYAKLLESEKE